VHRLSIIGVHHAERRALAAAPQFFSGAFFAVAQMTRCSAIIDASISFIDVSMHFDLRSPIADLR
jgi:hypothetical protein